MKLPSNPFKRCKTDDTPIFYVLLPSMSLIVLIATVIRLQHKNV